MRVMRATRGAGIGEGDRCSVIHNLKMVCPQGHVFAAISYNDAVRDQADAAYHLGLGAHLVAKGGPPVCAVCGAITFTLDDEVTEYRSMSEAIPALTEIAIKAMRERDQLSSSDDRN